SAGDAEWAPRWCAATWATREWARLGAPGAWAGEKGEHAWAIRRQDPHCCCPSPFDAQHLLELCDDLHEVGLLVHHGMDVFISLWNLIHDAVIFAAFDAGGLLAQVFRGEPPFGFSA